LRLAKGEAGIQERPPALTLADFVPRFESAIQTLCAEKPATIRFYQENGGFAALGARVESARSGATHRGERNREFVLNHGLEPKYLEAAPQPLRDIAILMLETGVRPGEAVNLR
jgi:hypothetical protein